MNDPVPSPMTLGANVPSPFNAPTEIHYSITEPSQVSLVIYDASGRRVKTLISEQVEPGDYTAAWDGRDDVGNYVASGVYLYQLKAGKDAQRRRMSLVK